MLPTKKRAVITIAPPMARMTSTALATRRSFIVLAEPASAEPLIIEAAEMPRARATIKMMRNRRSIFC